MNGKPNFSGGLLASGFACELALTSKLADQIGVSPDQGKLLLGCCRIHRLAKRGMQGGDVFKWSRWPRVLRDPW